MLEGRRDVTVDDVIDYDVTTSTDPLEYASMEEVLEGFLSFGGRTLRDRALLTNTIFERNGQTNRSELGHKNGETEMGEVSMSEVTSVNCANPKCVNSIQLSDVKTYKLCVYCYTYYCCRICRKNDYDAHIERCHNSKVNIACKQIVMKVNKDPYLQYKVSRLASRGYKLYGRGCVTLCLPDLYTAERFLNDESHNVKSPVFVPIRELPSHPLFGSMLKCLLDSCQEYNPSRKFILHVSVGVRSDLEQIPRRRSREHFIQKGALLKISPAHDLPREGDENCHMVLLPLLGETTLGAQNPREIREASFMAVQRKLRNKGISLRQEFPNSYNKLIDFVADGRCFVPEVFQTVDSVSGERFMCVIMLETASDVEWLQADFPPDFDPSVDERCPLSPLTP